MFKSKILSSVLVAPLFAGVLASDDAAAKGNNHQGPDFRFALVGDVPYAAGDVAKFDAVIDDINEAGVKFVAHVGDIKGGSDRCSDELITERFEQYEQFDAPFVYTPGDNEWTDCHREAAGQYNPIERLDFVRNLFFPHPGKTTGGKRMRVRTQAQHPAYREYVENVLFVRKRVVFSTIHIVGSNNGLRPWSGIGEDPENPIAERLEEVAEREAASIAWLRRTFREAHRRHAKGVLLFIHANPRFELPQGDPNRAGFDAFLAELVDLTVAFDRPVVVAHGDSHYFRIDKPLMAPTVDGPMRRLADVTRVETFGSADVHWVEVTVDPRTDNVFHFEPRIVDSNKFERP
ncbi:MAG: hypothetical protein B7733_11270 [Myxococcales bacterium FL481]|nr:MAG: hypothetical protein B7733_11270 [Myxococcales bacterium FL481]